VVARPVEAHGRFLNMLNRRRWAAEVSDEKAAPTGQAKYLKLAMTALGPFEHRLMSEVAEGVPCEEYARNETYKLATDFNRQRLLNNGAPRPKDVTEELRQVSLRAGQLASALSSLNDLTRGHLQAAGSKKEGDTSSRRLELFKQSNAKGLPSPTTATQEASDGLWIEQLNALRRLSDGVSRSFKAFRGVGDNDRIDKGGNTNLHRELYGPPEWTLVTRGWFVFEQFKPGIAAGTGSNAFHVFLKNTAEYAAGSDPNEKRNVLQAIQRIIAPLRRSDELIHEAAQIDRRIRELEAQRPISRKTEVLIEKLTKKVEGARKERGELWPKLSWTSATKPR
jgi:hypothetical protein